MQHKITYDELHKKFIYLAPEGLLIKISTGKVVGTPETHGYLIVTINKKPYYVHRVVYCMYYGHWPENDIEHINQILSDNRICNLREVSKSCNLKNAKLSCKNISGIKGISWNKNRHKWAAHIWNNGKKVHLGIFKYFINAVKARHYAEQKFGYNICDYSTPATEYLKNIESFSKIIITTNVDTENLVEENTLEREWTNFRYTQKRKIDSLIEA